MRLIRIHLRQHIIEGVQVIALLRKILDVFVQLLFVGLAVFHDDRRCIVDKEEAVLDNVDGSTAKHGNR